MPFILGLLTIILSYLLGSVPFGLLVVKLATGKDIRHIESGRTGGTNAIARCRLLCRGSDCGP